AHCRGHNADSIGICYIGGRRRGEYADTRTPQQKAALLQLLSNLKKLYPNAKIYGHRDFAAKACPCFDARREYGEL
ncbi:MAG: N-acetylmuramoyl-L-alanine amidase, partial [Bacteroidaceae bacterium]|nr:N-acetylmuramoyl-L-alanine amidase [Bacteroidaceae bacterium]